MEFIVVVLAV